MIMITGDTHGNFHRFTTKAFPIQKELTREDILIICGDFGGVWRLEETKEEAYWLNWLAAKNFTICFVDGNHENFDRLNRDYPIVNFNGGCAHKIRENIYHLMRGEVFIFEGKKFFTFGGARSHDIKDGIFDADDKKAIKEARKSHKSFRIRNVSWWESEMPNEAEKENGLKNLAMHNYEVDYIISHDLPINVLKSCWTYMEMNALNGYLDYINEKVKFRKWFGGHHHIEENIFGKYYLLYEKIICLNP